MRVHKAGRGKKEMSELRVAAREYQGNRRSLLSLHSVWWVLSCGCWSLIGRVVLEAGVALVLVVVCEVSLVMGMGMLGWVGWS